MSDEKKITERDAVLRERAAFVRGFEHGAEYRNDGDGSAAAKSFYPLPKVTRPRVVADPHRGFDHEWRVCGTAIEWRCTSSSSGWHLLGSSGPWTTTAPATITHMTPERIAMWADLLARPFETAEDDA